MITRGYCSYPGPVIRLLFRPEFAEIAGLMVRPESALSDGPSDGPSDGLSDEPSNISPLVYVGFGVAAAGLIVGAVTGGLALSAASDAKEGCDANNNCPSDPPMRSIASRPSLNIGAK